MTPENCAKRGLIISEADLRRMWMDMSISVEEIGRRIGISGNSVKRRAKRRGFPPRPSGRPFARKFDHGRIIALYRAGLSMKAVADTVGCRLNNVHSALRLAGVPSRSRYDRNTVSSLLAAAMAASARETKAAMRDAEMIDGFVGRPRKDIGIAA